LKVLTAAAGGKSGTGGWAKRTSELSAFVREGATRE